MRTMKFLMCVACLCSAAVFARTAMTQEKPVLSDNPQNLDPFGDPLVEGVNSLPARQKPPRRDSGFDEQPVLNPPDFPEPVPGKPARFTPLMRPRRVTRTVIETFMEPIPQEELEASKKLQAAVQSLKTGKDEAARKAAADVIQQQLTTQFESDLKQCEKELAEVEQRVKTLREQLDKRKAAQAEIINLRLQTLVNDADGLGFPDPNFGTNAQSAPTLYGDDLDRPVSRPRQVPQFRQTDPVDPDSRPREPARFFVPDAP